LLEYERKYWTGGTVRLAGVDEAGRGPLAGPVVAAAVVFDPGFAEVEEHRRLEGLTDSKQLTPRRRRYFHDLLCECSEVQVGVGLSDVAEIDSLNILQATHLAMRRALESLPEMPAFALVDGLPARGLPLPADAIVHGDALSLSIAAASVIAKVARDRIMTDFDAVYPEYGFASHKGYGSPAHIQALLEHGPCPIHRRSFRPVREAIEIREMRRRHAGGTEC